MNEPASLPGPRIAANQPTPLVGVWERNIAAFLLWVIVLAVVLLRENPLPFESRAGGSDGMCRK